MKTIAENVRAIFDAYEAENTTHLGMEIYHATEAGVSVSFRLSDDSVTHFGDAKRAINVDDATRCVVAIGVSSIVEGSDAEVPMHWVSMSDEDAPTMFAAVVQHVNDEACRLWHEANDEKGI